MTPGLYPLPKNGTEHKNSQYSLQNSFKKKCYMNSTSKFGKKTYIYKMTTNNNCNTYPPVFTLVNFIVFKLTCFTRTSYK